MGEAQWPDYGQLLKKWAPKSFMNSIYYAGLEHTGLPQ